MEVSVTAAFNNLHSYIHPQVIITDYSPREDTFFTRSLRNKAQELDTPIIELPPDAAETLMWMTRLDTGSLRGKGALLKYVHKLLRTDQSSAWHKANVELLIHAPPKSSGSLIRLLRSIETADYFESKRPDLTIELPADIDPPTQQFVENLVWPPADGSNQKHVSQVTLRHRIPRDRMASEEASVRLVESFYPQSPSHSHLLLLSSQTELSPHYYHYLKYVLLEYRYSSYGFQTPQNLLGISLELPSSHLNDSSPFTPPLSKPSPYSRAKPNQPTSFLWQAPDSNAALYFGDKWIEFHSFLSKRLEAKHSAQPDKPTPKHNKLVSEHYPSWMEYLLELMRARGYSVLYPNFDSTDGIVTIHNELYQPPEEFASHTSVSDRLENSTPATPSPTDALTADPSTYPLPKPPQNKERPLLTTSLLNLLPSEGDLPELTTIPRLSYNGRTITSADATTLATFYSGWFKSEIGGCTGLKPKLRRPMSAADLFCFADEGEGEDWKVEEDIYDDYAENWDGEEGDEGRVSTQSLSSATSIKSSMTVTQVGPTATGRVHHAH